MCPLKIIVSLNKYKIKKKEAYTKPEYRNICSRSRKLWPVINTTQTTLRLIIKNNLAVVLNFKTQKTLTAYNSSVLNYKIHFDMHQNESELRKLSDAKPSSQGTKPCRLGLKIFMLLSNAELLLRI